MVELKSSDEILAKDICMQIVASNPLAIDESSLDKNILKSEKDIYKQELDKLDKKEDINKTVEEFKDNPEELAKRVSDIFGIDHVE